MTFNAQLELAPYSTLVMAGPNPPAESSQDTNDNALDAPGSLEDY